MRAPCSLSLTYFEICDLLLLSDKTILKAVNLTHNTMINTLKNGGLISLLDAGCALKFQIVNLDLSYT